MTENAQAVAWYEGYAQGWEAGRARESWEQAGKPGPVPLQPACPYPAREEPTPLARPAEEYAAAQAERDQRSADLKYYEYTAEEDD